MQIRIKEELEEIAAEIFSLRKQIHMYPETGNNEFRTTGLIQEYLESAGIHTERMLETGVTGFIRGDLPGKTVALRADIDALPLTEKTGADFASVIQGKMHACGHDVHTAALLGAAKLISNHRDELVGNVILIFQPDEEGDGGAARLIGKGVLSRADAVFGAHVSPDLPEGTAGVRYGGFYAAADLFDAVVSGCGAHAAEREKGADALAAAAKMTTDFIRIPEQIKPGRSVVTVGAFHSGTVRNILADRAELSGIIRTIGQDARDQVWAEIQKIAADADLEYGTGTEIKYVHGYPGIVNDDRMTALAESAAAAVLGEENVVRISDPTMMTEDFGCYLNEVPGSFYHIGAGCSKPLHSPEFLAADQAVLTAAAVHISVVTAFLSLHEE